MQSSANNVTDYLAEVPIDRQPALIRLRELCLTTLTGYEESMQYGGPTYSRDHSIEVGFASQKHFIGLYILKNDVIDKNRHLLNGKGISLGKGCIRYSQPEKIDFDLVEKLLIDTRESSGGICA